MLGQAISVEIGRPVDLVLCTPTGTERHQPSAVRGLLATTPDCAAILAGLEATPVARIVLPDGEVEVLTVPTAA